MSSGAEQTEAEKRKYSKIWQIRVNVEERRTKDRQEAEERLLKADAMNYDTMFMKGNKEIIDPKKAGKDGQGDKKGKGRDGKKDKKKNFDDEFEPPNVSDDQILQGLMDTRKK